MDIHETLGVLAHRGGLLVSRPELTVGVVSAVSRTTGLELDLLARRPLDRRDADQRRADIQAGRSKPRTAPRRLLPAHDEGIELRVGWLTGDGRARWEYGSVASSSGDHFAGVLGPSLRTVLDLPPLFDEVSIVLAWPEIGFPETVVELPLPDRAAVERGTVSIWDAPVMAGEVAESLIDRTGTHLPEELAIETGRVVAGPRVLSRAADAVLVLDRLTAVGGELSMEILSVARGDRARAIRSPAESAGIAVVEGNDAVWIPMYLGSAQGGGRTFRATAEFALRGHGDGVLDLVVAWPAAGLRGRRVRMSWPG